MQKTTMSLDALRETPSVQDADSRFTALPIWADAAPTSGSPCMFRKVFRVAGQPIDITLSIVAELRYRVWVNGQYVGHGIVSRHPHQRFIETHDLAHACQVGSNVIAILADAPDLDTHYQMRSDHPFVAAHLTITDQAGDVSRLQTDTSWRVCSHTGWRRDVPRSGWALPPIDCYQTVAAHRDWQALDFDDSHWGYAQKVAVYQPLAETVQLAPTPPLRYGWAPAQKVLACYQSPIDPPRLEPNMREDLYAGMLSNAMWQRCKDVAVDLPGTTEGTMRIRHLDGRWATAIDLDLGCEQVGQIVFDIKTASTGVIDIGWAEGLDERNRPQLLRHGYSYLNRMIVTEAGQWRWEPMGYSGMRYLTLVFYQFDGDISFDRLGVRTSEPNLPRVADVRTEDQDIQALWDLCERTVRIGTQHCIMDCPTREQAMYIGDGHLTGRWLYQLTGDARHWRYLVTQQFERQSPDGQLRDSVFCAHAHSLIDYNLLAVIGTRDYMNATGDHECVKALLPACRRVMSGFAARLNEMGLIDIGDAGRQRKSDQQCGYQSTPAHVQGLKWAENLFIDHPGCGSHNAGDAGIDRRQVNTALNALYIIALRAIADLEHQVGDKQVAQHDQQRADTISNQMSHIFWSPNDRLFADGLVRKQLSPQYSQQTNVLCVWAGLIEADAARDLLQRIIETPGPYMAISGPYFWAYTLPLLAKHDLHSLALKQVKSQWGVMLDGGATTLWETFAGDDADTLCHPWAAAPLDMIQSLVLGIDPVSVTPTDVLTIRPMIGDVASMSGGMARAEGYVHIQWERIDNGKQVRISGELPTGVKACLTPIGTDICIDIKGQWSHDIPISDDSKQPNK